MEVDVGIRLLRAKGAAVLNPFAKHRAEHAAAIADDRSRWQEIVQAAVGGIEPDAAAVADLMGIGERWGLADVESEFRGDVAALAALAAAERQMQEMVPPRPGDVVAKELREAEAKVRALRHEQARVAAVVHGRGALLREIETMRRQLPDRLKGGAR
jgi:hypothetical protein